MISYQTSDVAITHNDNESKAIVEGLELINATSLFSEDDVVVLIPNWVNMDKPDSSSGITVGTKSLQTIIQYLKNMNVKKLVVATGSGGGDTLEVMKKVGYDEIIKNEGIPFIDFNEGPYDVLKIHHHVIKKLKVNKIIAEATKIISFTQLKQHEEAVMSASIKNVMMSIPSTEEHGTPKKNLGIHDDLHGFIAHMAENIKIDLSIVSCNPTMVGTGPSKGAPYHTGLVIVGNNPISTDTVGARLLGFKPQAIAYLYQLKQKGLTETNIAKINLTGLKIRDAELIFSQKVYRNNIAVDN